MRMQSSLQVTNSQEEEGPHCWFKGRSRITPISISENAGSYGSVYCFYQSTRDLVESNTSQGIPAPGVTDRVWRDGGKEKDS